MADNRKLRDFKNYRSGDSSLLAKFFTILIITALIALLAWMTQRDGHLLADSYRFSEDMELREEAEREHCHKMMVTFIQ